MVGWLDVIMQMVVGECFSVVDGVVIAEAKMVEELSILM